ncbi:Arogenate dehydrogenase [Kingella potus]|uniref:Arogenate dehydrogenase n=1 Tax=Kingella potus TaxID=265175 RepID=A0A377QZP0_9NEIS|nr:prephenate dehydrogenase [Kingella potus]UOP01132.1 prephenate dehydrogenase [Kingella potus]STR00836.1 Arogenate dehydrogenase [Kingella potus]
MTGIPPVRKLVLIGTGLIGGSFALDLKRLGLAEHIAGIDTDGGNLERALAGGIIDSAHAEICARSVSGADFVLIATPVSALPAVCRALAPHLAAGAVVCDTGSTKQSSLAAFAACLPQHLPDCVAAHPAAGSERHGASAARHGLFAGNRLVICPHPAQNPQAEIRAAALWQAVGAQVCRMDAAVHDTVFAAVSHLPHLLAFSYVAQILARPDAEACFANAASGFRDFTRLASSSPALWRDICLDNRAALAGLVRGQIEQLEHIEALLHNNDGEGLYRCFEQAKRARDQWLEGREKAV